MPNTPVAHAKIVPGTSIEFGTSERYLVKQLRSGKSYQVKLAYRVLKSPRSLDLPALLRVSTAKEEEFLNMHEDDLPPLPLPSLAPARPCIGAEEPAMQPAALPSASWFYSRPAGVTTSLKHANRKRKRQETRAQDGYTLRSEVLEKHVVRAASAPKRIDLNLSELPAAQGAYVGKPQKQTDAETPWTPESLVEVFGFEHKRWNGIDPFVLVNEDDCMYAYFVGRPNDDTYVADAEGLYNVLKAEGANLGPIATHRRGRFHAINAGITHNNGTTEPINLDNKEYNALVDRLLADQRLQRLAAFATTSFKAWAPKLYTYYKGYLDRLFKEMPWLRRIFDHSIFTTAAFNFGPNVCTFKHRDVSNLPFGLCAIQALGRFDPTTGGQIILWEARLVVDFPPASLIFIPSATITHSNCIIADGEERASFTQYCPGGLFRWVDYGFQLETDLKKKNPVLYQDVLRLRPHRWAMGLQLLTLLGWGYFAGGQNVGHVVQILT